MTKKIKVLIAEDHKIVREGLVYCFQDQPNIIVVGKASNGKEAIEKSLELNPDVVLMDFGMPEMNGLEAAKVLTKKLPDIRVLVLTAHHESEYISEFVKHGAKGYVLKDISSDELIRAIESVGNGGTYFGSEAKKVVIKDYLDNIKSLKKGEDLLSNRELEVLKFIAEGYANKEIADKLDLSVKTINYHRENIVKKLNIHTVAGLTKYAIEKGFIKIQTQ
jgi:two-component system, NarL family, nitrate/nitrite response regulator NarL